MLSPYQIKQFISRILLLITGMSITTSTQGHRNLDQEGTQPLSAAAKTAGQVLWQFDTGG